MPFGFGPRSALSWSIRKEDGCNGLVLRTGRLIRPALPTANSRSRSRRRSGSGTPRARLIAHDLHALGIDVDAFRSPTCRSRATTSDW